VNTLLIVSSILITFALIFYSIGVWAERLSKYLKRWHIIAFWAGFTFDCGGTFGMHLLSHGLFDFSKPHTLTGQIALWLMLAHAIWATVVVFRGRENTKRSFHRFSIIVWCIWLIPYIGGMFMGMAK
jgi:uncharacterized repeat protein (TIGR03987 family)